MRFKFKKLLVLSLSVMLLAPTFIQKSYAADDEWIYIRDEDPCADYDKMKNKGSRDFKGGTDGGFLTPGSQANKVAHAIFDTLTEDWGFSSAAAIGVLANCNHESGFIPNRAEEPSQYNVPYTGSDAVPSANPNYKAFDMNSADPIENMGYYADRTPPFLGGGGLFQFTPYTKFTDSKRFGEHGDGWDPVNQVAFLMDEFANGDLLVGGGIESTVKAAGQQVCSSAEDFFGTDSPEKAASSFYAWYERGAGAQNRDIEARKVWESGEFDTSIDSDPSKWPDVGSGKSKSIDASGALKKKAKEECKGDKINLSSEFNQRCVELALSRVGGQYVLGSNVWGETWADAITDCSGLVMMTLQRAGLKTALPRTAAEQGLQMREWGWEIEKEDLVPGDVVCFTNNGGGLGAAHHIAFYGGKNETYPDGFFIHASNPDVGIVVGAFYEDPQMYYFHPQESDGVEFGEPDMSDTDELVDFETAKSRSRGKY